MTLEEKEDERKRIAGIWKEVKEKLFKILETIFTVHGTYFHMLPITQ